MSVWIRFENPSTDAVSKEIGPFEYAELCSDELRAATEDDIRPIAYWHEGWKPVDPPEMAQGEMLSSWTDVVIHEQKGARSKGTPTPGPWGIFDEERELDPDRATGPPLITAWDDTAEETIDIAEVMTDVDGWKENARLIAKAPRMRELLGQFCWQFEGAATRQLFETYKEIKSLLEEISK